MIDSAGEVGPQIMLKAGWREAPKGVRRNCCNTRWYMTGSSFRLKPAEQRLAIIGLNVSVTNLPQLKCLALALILTSCAREDALSTKCDPAE